MTVWQAVRNLGQFLFPVKEGEDPEVYLAEVKGREWLFIIIRGLWVPLVFLLAVLHEPISVAAMRWIGVGLAFFNIIAIIINSRELTTASRRVLGLCSMIMDGLFAWALIFLFVYDFYTAAYASYVYIVIQASIRYGLAGGLVSLLSFIVGLLGAYMFRKWEYGVRFSTSGFVYWSGIVSIVAISVGSLVQESSRMRRISVRRMRDHALLMERHRISRDLHDSVLKTLQGLFFEARALATRTNEGSVKETVQYIANVCQRTSMEIRNIILELRNESTEGPIGERLSQILTEWQRSTGIDVNYQPPEPETALPVELAGHIVSIVAEGLSNVARHAAASRVTVTLTVNPEEVVLSIVDDGKGMVETPDDVPLLLEKGKVGLISMKERTEAAGGRFEFKDSDPGTSLIFHFPRRKIIPTILRRTDG